MREIYEKPDIQVHNFADAYDEIMTTSGQKDNGNDLYDDSEYEI